jgi:hypothetical protein
MSLKGFVAAYRQPQNPNSNKPAPYEGDAPIAGLFTDVAPVHSQPPVYASARQAISVARSHDGARSLAPKEYGPHLPLRKYIARVLRNAFRGDRLERASNPGAADVAGRLAVAATTAPRHSWEALNANTAQFPAVNPLRPAGYAPRHAKAKRATPQYAEPEPKRVTAKSLDAKRERSMDNLSDVFDAQNPRGIEEWGGEQVSPVSGVPYQLGSQSPAGRIPIPRAAHASEQYPIEQHPVWNDLADVGSHASNR